MSLLLDASALLNIIRSLGKKSIPLIRGNYVLTLTSYEVGNVLWEEAILLKRITVEEALQLLKIINSVLTLLNTMELQDRELTLKVACTLKITYYDAAYIVTAYKLNAELVTDDDKLRRKVEEHMEILKEILGGKITVRTSTEMI